MSKKFASSVIILVLVNLLVKFVWIFGVERGFQLKVGFENYGLYYSLFNFTAILSVIAEGGLSNFLIRSVATDEQKQQNTFWLKITLSAIYILIAYVAGQVFGYPRSYFKLLFILSIYQMLFSFLTYLRAFLKGNQLFKADTFFSVFDRMLLVFLFIPLLYIRLPFNLDIYFFALAQVLALLFSIITCSVILYKNNCINVSTFKFAFKWDEIKKIMPYTLFAFLVLAYYKVDSVMLEKLLPNGKIESGVYAAAYRLLDASNLLPILFASLFLPILSKNLSNPSALKKLIDLSFETLISWALILALSCWFYRFQLMQLLYGEANSEYLSKIFGILMLSAPLITIYYIFSTVLTAKNQLKTLNSIASVGLVLNIVLNLYMIPNYQALGAAIATLITLLVTGFSYSLFALKKVENGFSSKQTLKIICLTAMLCLTGLGLQYVSINWMLSFIAFVSLGSIYTFSLRLISLKRLLELLIQK